MYPCFDVDGISAENLLQEWTWLVQGEFGLLAVNPFGDLFLKGATGTVHRLDVTSGSVSAIAPSAKEFSETAKAAGARADWFLEGLAVQAEQKGLSPGKGQCVGYKVPAVFKESADTPNNAYVADLYEYVAFMGDLHRQINGVPDGGKVQIKIQSE